MVGLPSHPADTLVMDAQLMQLLSVLQQGDTGLPATGSTLDTLVNAEEMIDAGIQHLMAWKAQQQLENNRRQLLQQLKALDLVGAALAGAGTSAGPEQCDQGKCLADALSVSQVPRCVCMACVS